MPCRGPSPEEYKAMMEHLNNMKDPEYARKYNEDMERAHYEWEHGGKQAFEEKLRLQQEQDLKLKEMAIEKEIESRNLENMSFNSFMTVFLCKALEIIDAKDLWLHTYHDMEWWYKEHKKRDNNNNVSDTPKKELIEKLMNINEYYKVK